MKKFAKMSLGQFQNLNFLVIK